MLPEPSCRRSADWARQYYLPNPGALDATFLLRGCCDQAALGATSWACVACPCIRHSCLLLPQEHSVPRASRTPETLRESLVLDPDSMASSTIPIELPGQVGFLATATICMVLPTALVVLRILARRRTSLSLNGSDFCIVAALVCHPSHASPALYCFSVLPS